MSFLKVWGCEAYVKKLASDKLAPKSEKLIFLGYPKETKGYYFLNRSENTIIVARNAFFLEREFLSRRKSGRKIDLDEIEDPQVVSTSDIPQGVVDREPDESQGVVIANEEQTLRRSGRVSRQPDRYVGYLITTCGDLWLLESCEPTTYDGAITGNDSEKWLGAMRSEMDSMYENQVWDLVDLPEGSRTVDCKWLYKVKNDMDGNPSIYKARLVARGFTQIYGVDFVETFSPVASVRSIRIVLAIAAYHDYEIWQMDVKTAFLNGFLEEVVYMTQPEGFLDPSNPNKVCKLKRSIYGLKQASRSWNFRFDQVIKKFDFLRSEEEPCVYMKFSGSKVVILVLYVDDILLIGNDIPMLVSVKTWLGKNFQMKDLGEAQYILGMKIYRDRSKKILGLNQEAYIDKVLDKFRMTESKKGLVPMSCGTILSKT